MPAADPTVSELKFSPFFFFFSGSVTRVRNRGSRGEFVLYLGLDTLRSGISFTLFVSCHLLKGFRRPLADKARIAT